MREAQICQSCGMPMEKSEDFGTNADGSRNEDYCCFCFQNGDFTSPDLTMEQMIDRLVRLSDKMGMSQTQARTLAKTVIPKLKRWQPFTAL
jgi:hypothetical protein